MRKVGLSPVDINDNDIDAVTLALKSGWLAHGENNTVFENEFSKYLNIDFSLSLNSCTSALDLALRCFDFPPGSEVIIPSFTWVSTGNVVILNNLIPVFADINLSDFQINLNSIEKLITDKTVAIIGVHFSGFLCDVVKIDEICKKNNIIFIEDSAECLGVKRDGRSPGSTGIGCFSFYPTKNMTTCEGGMLTTSDPEIFKKCKALSAHGIEKSTFERDKNNISNVKPNWYREATTNGFNFRMPNPLAALGRSQLLRLDEMVLKRQNIATRYTNILSKKKDIALPKYEYSKGKSSFQMYVFRVIGNINKVQLIEQFRERGINASSHFDPPLHEQKAFKAYNKYSLPNTIEVSKSIISLPMSSALCDEDVDYVCEILESLIS